MDITTICERLEQRRLLAGITFTDGVLRIKGTPLADNVVFERLPGGKLDVRIDNAEGSIVKAQPTSLTDISRIEVDAGGGDDIVIVGKRHIPALLVGGNGNDTLSGGYANDTLSGGNGDDFLSGSVGADTLLGNDGNDELWPGTGSNIVGGGRGNDQLVLDGGAHRGPGPGGADLSAELITDVRGNPNNHPSRVRVNLAGFTPKILLTTRDGRRLAVVDFYVNDGGYAFEWGTGERVGDTFSVHVEGFDRLDVYAAAAFFHKTRVFDLGPADGNLPDRIVVSSPDDGVVVSRNVVRGDDEIPSDFGLSPTFPELRGEVRDGVATVLGTAENDQITASIVGDELVVSELIAGQVRFDLTELTGLRIDAGFGDDFVNTPIDLPVTLVGGDGNDTLGSGDADDNLEGGNGDDLLSGTGGDDVLDGGAGDDQLFSGTGINELIGGAGFDWFRNGDSRGWDRTLGVEQRRSRPGERFEKRTEWSDTPLFGLTDPMFNESALKLYRNVNTNDGVGFLAQLDLSVPSRFQFDVTTGRVGDDLVITLDNPRSGRRDLFQEVIVFGEDATDLPTRVVVVDAVSDRVVAEQAFDPATVQEEPSASGFGLGTVYV